MLTLLTLLTNSRAALETSNEMAEEDGEDCQASTHTRTTVYYKYEGLVQLQPSPPRSLEPKET